MYFNNVHVVLLNKYMFCNWPKISLLCHSVYTTLGFGNTHLACVEKLHFNFSSNHYQDTWIRWYKTWIRWYVNTYRLSYFIMHYLPVSIIRQAPASNTWHQSMPHHTPIANSLRRRRPWSGQLASYCQRSPKSCSLLIKSLSSSFLYLRTRYYPDSLHLYSTFNQFVWIR